MTGFDIFVGSFEDICQVCSDNRRGEYRHCEGPDRHLAFPGGFSPSDILQLGAAVTSLTGVADDFGSDNDRREPKGGLFVDRLTPEWVEAAATLPPDSAQEIEARWIAGYVEVEDRRPPWATQPQGALIRRFLELCARSSSEKDDLVMVWEL